MAMLFSGRSEGAEGAPELLPPPPSTAAAEGGSGSSEAHGAAWQWQQLSRSHKPTMLSEIQRVWATPEGFVEVHGVRVLAHNFDAVARDAAAAQALGRKANYRINRDILMSRAVGDADLKQFGVIPTPDVTVTALPSGPSFLVVATDGVWDVVTPEGCCTMLERGMVERPASEAEEGNGTTTIEGGAAERVAEIIVESACGVQKNNDDVTAVVASFGS